MQTLSSWAQSAIARLTAKIQTGYRRSSQWEKELAPAIERGLVLVEVPVTVTVTVPLWWLVVCNDPRTYLGNACFQCGALAQVEDGVIAYLEANRPEVLAAGRRYIEIYDQLRHMVESCKDNEGSIRMSEDCRHTWYKKTQVYDYQQGQTLLAELRGIEEQYYRGETSTYRLYRPLIEELRDSEQALV